MRNVILVLIALCCATITLEAQRTETLFGRARTVGAFGAPIIEYQYTDGKAVDVLAGGGGAIVINNFFIGGYGVGSAPNSVFDIPDIRSLEFGHGGLWVGATYKKDNLIHFYSSLKLGWGGIGIEFDDDDFNFQDGVSVFQPEGGLEVNIFRWLRVAGTASYRFVDGISRNTGLEAGDLNGFGMNLTFRIGWFGSSWKNNRFNNWD